MDRSFGSSSMIRAAPSGATAATYSCSEEEESGWTKYFEDFSNSNRADHQEQTSFCSSMVSDASSAAAAWRVSQTNRVPKKLKKTRIKRIGDHDLEDTASSPVNSPKIGDFRPVDHMNPRKMDDLRININSLGDEEMKQAEENSSDCHGKNGPNTDLKKKGLCLVPLNLLADFI